MNTLPEFALNRLRDEFPFPGYVEENTTPYKTVGDVISKYLVADSKVFDFGSGPCDKTAIAAFMGMECHACDDLADDWHLRGNTVDRIFAFADKCGIELSREYRPPEAESFDMVMMNDVLEHIADSPRELLLSLVNGLKPNGLLFATVPNIANIRKRLAVMRGRTNLPNYDLYYWYQGPWRGPKREYVRGDLVSMGENLGLEQVEIYTVHHMLKNLRPALHLPYRAITTIFPDWRDTFVYIGRKPQNWKAKHSLVDDEFAKIIEQTGKQGLHR